MLTDDLIQRFRDSLFAGHYNLLLGSGISLESRNHAGDQLRSSERLRQDLCALVGARPTTSLPRVYGLLSPEQRQKEITNKYSGCTPGPELAPLRDYLWKRILTFNVDDVVESLYEEHSSQTLDSLNFDSGYKPETNRSEVQCIHLHGHVLLPESGYVFAHSEYVAVMNTGLD